MRKILLIPFVALLLQVSHAQNPKSDDVEYTYIQLPTTPLAKSISNYQSYVIAAYAEQNRKLKADYDAEMAKAEAEYQQEMAAYPAKVQAAEDRYAAEMKEWEKKSFGEKLLEKEILKENNKPVKQIPSPPSRRYVNPPVLKTEYDYRALASTYMVLDGYNNQPDNAVKIELTMYGFDYTQPQIITSTKNITTVSNGQSSTRPVTYYHLEFTYRHAMSVKVTDPDGKELLFTTPQELNNYKTYKTADNTTYPSFNTEQLVKPYEEKILQENLRFLSDMVNDRFGFKRVLRKTELSYVKAKDDTYSDLLLAFNEGSSALKTLIDDEQNAKAKLEHAVEIWNKALEESDPNNKKARIDKDVTIMIYLNLLEVNFALRNVEAGEKAITALNTLALSNGERKQKEKYEVLFADLKKRLAANR